MQLDVLNIEGKKTGRSVNLSDEIFGIQPNDHLIYMAVKHYLAGKHRGTHKTKGRSEVKGSTRKLHRQKGTGGSRKGDIKNPLYHGGGTVFGPRPHGYGFKMNRKEKDLAKMSALAYKASGEAIRIIESFQLEAPKTRTAAAALESLEVAGKKVLYVTADRDEKVSLSLRNIPRVKEAVLSDINTYDIVNSHFLVLTEEAANILSDEKEEREIQDGTVEEAQVEKVAEEKRQEKKEGTESKPENRETVSEEKENVSDVADNIDNKDKKDNK